MDMTIKELYEWAVENNVEDYGLIVYCECEGCIRLIDEELKIDHECQDVSF